MKLTHIGGPTVLVELGRWRLLTDPTFDSPGRSYRFGWGSGSRKLTGPAVAAEDIGPIDLVLLTHDHHGDNLDSTGRALLPRVGAVVTTVSGASRLGGNAHGLAPWQTRRFVEPDRPELEIVATPCRHGPPFSRPIAGEATGFALRLDGSDSVQLWISGDTVYYKGVRQVAERITVDIALLHLGGVRFPITGPVRYTMTGRDAVELCTLLKPRIAIPVHYEGWKHFHDGRAEIEDAFARSRAEVHRSLAWLEPGVAAEFPDASTASAARRPDILTAH